MSADNQQERLGDLEVNLLENTIKEIARNCGAVINSANFRGDLTRFRERTYGSNQEEILDAEYSVGGTLQRLTLKVDYDNVNGDRESRYFKIYSNH